MSRFDDSIDWDHPSFSQIENGGSSSATSAAPRPDAAPRRTQFAPNVRAARPAHATAPPPASIGFMGGMSKTPASSFVSTGVPSRPRPPAAASSSLPPQPDWLQRAYGAPASSPLATHRADAQSASYPARAQTASAGGLRFTNGSSGVGGVSGGGFNRPNSARGNGHAHAPGWETARSVAFPADFNPNAAPALPQRSVSRAAVPPPSQSRTTFFAPESDVPKGRKPRTKKLDLGEPLPAHLQSYVHLPRGKLPSHLTSADRALLKAERRRVKLHEKSLTQGSSDAKKAAEQIELDVFHSEQSRERGGWNALRIKVSFQLCSPERIAVETMPPNELTVIHVVQSCDGAVFDQSLHSTQVSKYHRSTSSDSAGRRGLWTIPISAYDACLARCAGLRTESRDIVLVPVDSKHLRSLRGDADQANKLAMKFESMQGIPTGLANVLYPFQKVGVEFCVAHNGRAMIGDEMGLGKTIQAIAVAAYYQSDWPLLVVCPSSVRLTWKNELLKWLGVSSLRESDITTLSSDDEDSPGVDGFIDDDIDMEDGESEWQPMPREQERLSEKLNKADFVADDEEFDRILRATAPKKTAKSASRLVSKADSSGDDEAEYELPVTRTRTSSSNKRKRSPVDSDSDESSDESVPDEVDEDTEWQPRAKRNDHDDDDDAEEECTPIVKKRTKRRRIVDDSDEDEADLADHDASSVPAADDPAPTIPDTKSPPLSAKAAFKLEKLDPLFARGNGSSARVAPAALASRFEVGESSTPPTASATSPSADDEELAESLRLIAEMEEREQKKATASTAPVKQEGGVLRVKTEPQPNEVDVVDLVDSPVAVKSEPVHASATSKPAPVPWVSAASLIKPSIPENDFYGLGPKKQEYAPPVAKKETPAMPTPATTTAPASSKPAAAAAAAAVAATAAPQSSSDDLPAFVPPVKAPVRPAFRPLMKHEINVILNGRTPLMGQGLSSTRVVIMSYDLVAKYTLALQRQDFKLIIADECLAWDTQVALADGRTIAAQHVQPSMHLVGEDGRTVMVTSVDPSRTSDVMYEITHANGSAYTVTPNHRVTLRWNKNPEIVRTHETHETNCLGSYAISWHDPATGALMQTQPRTVRLTSEESDIQLRDSKRGDMNETSSCEGDAAYLPPIVRDTTSELDAAIWQEFFAQREVPGTPESKALFMGDLYELTAHHLADTHVWKQLVAGDLVSGRRTVLPGGELDAESVTGRAAPVLPPPSQPIRSDSYTTACQAVRELALNSCDNIETRGESLQAPPQWTFLAQPGGLTRPVQAGDQARVVFVANKLPKAMLQARGSDVQTALGTLDRMAARLKVPLDAAGGLIITATLPTVEDEVDSTQQKYDALCRANMSMVLQELGATVIVSLGRDASYRWHDVASVSGVSQVREGVTDDGILFTTFHFTPSVDRSDRLRPTSPCDSSRTDAHEAQADREDPAATRKVIVWHTDDLGCEHTAHAERVIARAYGLTLAAGDDSDSMGQFESLPLRSISKLSQPAQQYVKIEVDGNHRFALADGTLTHNSHYVKNGTAKRSQALLPLIERAKRALCLSGTPAMSRPYELYPQINALCPGVFGSAAQFGARYCAPSKGFRGAVEFKGAANLVELHMLLKQYLLIRRQKSEVLKDLRPKTRTVIPTTVHDKALQENMQRITNLRQMVASETQADGAEQSAAAASSASQLNTSSKKALVQLYADTGVAKLPFVLTYLVDMLESGIKFLVFAHHLAVLDGIEAFLRKQKAGYFRLDGSTKPTDRQAGVERFQTDPECRVALLSITAGGTGITLTAASTVVFAELQWTPALLRQAEDRVHRIGQFNPVNIYYILAKHTLDDLLWPLLSTKLEVLGAALDGREDTSLSAVRKTTETRVATSRPLPSARLSSHDSGECDLVDLTQGDDSPAALVTKPPVEKKPTAATGPRNWIGMSTATPVPTSSNTGSSFARPTVASAPAPRSLTAASRSHDSEYPLSLSQVHRAATRDALAQSAQTTKKLVHQMKLEAQDDLARFRVPSPTQHDQDAARDLLAAESDLDVSSRSNLGSESAPPPDAVIALSAGSDDDYDSDDSDASEEVTSLSVREVLERSRARMKNKHE